MRSLLYVAHGLYKPGMTDEQLEAQARDNVFLLLEVGVVGGVIDLLGLELEQGRGVYEGTRANITIADNLNLRGASLVRISSMGGSGFHTGRGLLGISPLNTSFSLH